MVIKNSLSQERGFNLIELMVVLAIVAILAAISYASYQDSIIKSRRGDGMHALLLAVTHQEKYYLDKNAYSLDMNNIGGPISHERFYLLSVENTLDGESCDVTNQSPPEAQCFTIRAEPQGIQMTDEKCKELQIDSLGRKAANDGVGDTTDICW